VVRKGFRWIGTPQILPASFLIRRLCWHERRYRITGREGFLKRFILVRTFMRLALLALGACFRRVALLRCFGGILAISDHVGCSCVCDCLQGMCGQQALMKLRHLSLAGCGDRAYPCEGHAANCVAFLTGG